MQTQTLTWLHSTGTATHSEQEVAQPAGRSVVRQIGSGRNTRKAPKGELFAAIVHKRCVMSKQTLFDRAFCFVEPFITTAESESTTDIATSRERGFTFRIAAILVCVGWRSPSSSAAAAATRQEGERSSSRTIGSRYSMRCPWIAASGNSSANRRRLTPRRQDRPRGET